MKDKEKEIDYSSIVISDISKDWLYKQRLNMEGRDLLRDKLRKVTGFDSELKRLTSEMEDLFIKYLYTIPQYKKYSDVFSDFLFSVRRHTCVSVSIDPSSFGYQFESSGFINTTTGISLDGSITVPLSEVNSKQFKPGGVFLHIKPYLPANCSVPQEWINLIENSSWSFKDNYLKYLSLDQEEELKSRYLKIIEGSWRSDNALNKYYSDGGFLENIKTFKQLEDTYPELVEPYFELNKKALIDRYCGTPEGKEMIISKGLSEDKLESAMFKVRSSLDYLRKKKS